MRWLVADSLYCPEAFFCSHLDSYSHYLREFGEDAASLELYGKTTLIGPGRWPVGSIEDVFFVLDRYGVAAALPAATKRIAQVAAICNPMPWDVRKPDGSPAYDLIISSIPWMVAEARAKGCRAELMDLCFDTRALTCGMKVTERDIPCLFVGTVGGNHRRRGALLAELGDVITVAPPTFGREYFELLARAQSVFHCGAEWGRGTMNAMRVYEAMGMGALLLADREPADLKRSSFLDGEHVAKYGDAASVRDILGMSARTHREIADCGQAEALTKHTYVQRVPELVRLARSL